MQICNAKKRQIYVSLKETLLTQELSCYNRFMDKNEQIILNTKASFAMEGMPLSEDDVKVMKDCLDGIVDFSVAVEALVRQYTQEESA